MLKVTKQGFKSPLHDNDHWYLTFIQDALKHSDPEAEMILNKFEDDIKVSIIPSTPDFRNHIIENMLGAHRLFKIKIIFSKSLTKEKRVNFLVNTN